MTKTLSLRAGAIAVAMSMFIAFAFLPVMASAAVVYNAIPGTLAPNYPSQPFQAQQTNEFGDYVHLGGTDRQLTTVAVTMSNWALQATPANVTFCAASASNCDATGFFWPITVNIYANTLTGGVPDMLLATKTVTQHIPWRPVADSSCSTPTAWRSPSNSLCYNGIASNTTFDLSSLNVTLPDDVIVGFVYDTQTYGPTPTGVDGPYNSLNIAVPPSDPVTVGTDDSNSEVFWNTETAVWYEDDGASGVGTFRKDTNWAPYGTVAMQINAITPGPSTVTVTINKFIDGAQATAGSANSSAFPMSATWNTTNIGAGTGAYDLDADGFNGNPTPYQAITSPMSSGADYSTYEITGGAVVGADCSTGQPYALVGYKSGDNLAAAQAAATSSTAPSFTNLTSDKVVLVLNKMCVPTPVHLSPANGSTLTSAALTSVDWTDVTDPAMPMTYRYQASNSSATNLDGSFVAPVYTSGVLAVSQIPAAGTPEGVYYWHVRAVDNNGNMSPWTSAWQVTVDNTPNPPANACETPLVAPAGFTLQNGTAGHDKVTLTPQTMFVGLGGNDKVNAGNGNYIICLGEGNDKVVIGSGESTIDSGNGNDKITTGNGNQWVKTGTGNDKITTGSGNDTINAGEGNNKVDSGAGNDSVVAGAGNDKFNGGLGTDTCNAGTGFNTVLNCEL